MKTVEPSLMAPEMKFHIIRPTVTWGRNSATGIWKSMEYSRPSAAAMTPVAMVIQNGPSTERR